MAYEFQECDTCSAKPGSPPLCFGCLANRATIFALQREFRIETAEIKTREVLMAEEWENFINENPVV